ncbi:general amidase [Suillus cothurnatus]|nr:general amidase [Suillus cothurnatus]
MPHWTKLIAEKQQRQLESIPQEWLVFLETCNLLTTREIEITNSSVNVLLEKLTCGEWTAVDVTTAFYKRAIMVHQLVNCLTEIFVHRALARAAELDNHFKQTGKVVGPLHGLPISLKDQLCIEGLETTMGYVSWIGRYTEKNAVLVGILIECGAVPFVRTNLPPTVMWPESFNNIFSRRTTNPHNCSLTPGGSSGGEGALVALKGSPLGGQDSVQSMFGPMTNSVDGVKAFMKAVVNAKPWLKDPLAVRTKWQEDEYNLADHGSGKDLCFAIMWDDGVVVPHPPIRRSLEMTKAALEKAGHKDFSLVDWKPIKHRLLADITVRNYVFIIRNIWNAASSEDYMITTSVTGEPIIATMKLDNSNAAAAPFHPKKIGITAYQLWQVQKLRRDIRKEYLDHWEVTVSKTVTGRPVDAIICPASSYSATPHGKNRYTNYTTVWNALDYPAATFPVTTVDPTLDTKKSRHVTHQHSSDFYDPETFKNAPICLQLVGRTLEEEAVIKMTEIVDGALAAAK